MQPMIILDDLTKKVESVFKDVGIGITVVENVKRLVFEERERCLNIVQSHERFYTKSIGEIAKEIADGNKN